MRTRLTGLKAWWVQRVSAFYMLLYSFGLHLLHAYQQWKAWIARPGMTVAVLVFLALLAHIWVGLRDVLLDYAKPASLRRLLLAMVALGLLGLGVWLLSILLRLQS